MGTHWIKHKQTGKPENERHLIMSLCSIPVILKKYGIILSLTAASSNKEDLLKDMKFDVFLSPGVSAP